MGNTPNTYGKPVYAQTPTQTVADLQAGVDFADKFAMFTSGTSAVRAALTSGQKRDGMEWYETDTFTRWQLINSVWRQVRSTTVRTRTTGLNINNSSGTLDFDTATTTPSVADFTYSGGQFTCVIPGVFLVAGLFSVAASGVAVAYSARIQKNGANVAEAGNVSNTVGSNCVPLLATVSLSTGDIVQVLWFANIAPAGMAMDVGTGKTYINLTRVG